MSTPSAKLLVYVGEKFACIKIVGRANFSSSIDFRTLVNELQQKSYKYFVLDLSECMLMDSTFLGVLAGFGLKMNAAQSDSSAPAIELLNPNARIADLLESLGVVHLFKLAEGSVNLPESTEARPHEAVSASREEVTRACLEAHRTLMQINPDNIPKFKEVAQFLADDLKRLKPADQ